MKPPLKLLGPALLLIASAGCSPLATSPDLGFDAAASFRHRSTAEFGPLNPTATQARAVSAGADTASLHYEVLSQYLPANLLGYERVGEPRGESVQLGGISYSTCEQLYRKGPHRLRVQVVDYNGAKVLYEGATALMSTSIWEENDEHLLRGCDLGLVGVRSYETLQKHERRASVALGVADRFFVSVESSGQADTRLVKAAARSLNLRGLAAL